MRIHLLVLHSIFLAFLVNFHTHVMLKHIYKMPNSNTELYNSKILLNAMVQFALSLQQYLKKCRQTWKKPEIFSSKCLKKKKLPKIFGIETKTIDLL
jgi:hypothetical protein